MEPSSCTGYHTGNGTPKKRCRLMFQSPFSPSTHASKRCRMCGRVPVQLATSLEQAFPHHERLHVPLAAGHDLERSVAPLVELDRVSDRLGLADELA